LESCQFLGQRGLASARLSGVGEIFMGSQLAPRSERSKSFGQFHCFAMNLVYVAEITGRPVGPWAWRLEAVSLHTLSVSNSERRSFDAVISRVHLVALMQLSELAVSARARSHLRSGIRNLKAIMRVAPPSGLRVIPLREVVVVAMLVGLEGIVIGSRRWNILLTSDLSWVSIRNPGFKFEFQSVRPDGLQRIIGSRPWA